MTDRPARHSTAAHLPCHVPFPLGDVVATPAALALLEQHQILPLLLLGRHLGGDWGDVPPDDAAANEAALRSGDRLLSSYSVGNARVWVITEADRSSTTLLLPSEY